MSRSADLRVFRAELKRLFIAGALVLFPLTVTLWLVWRIIAAVEGGVQRFMQLVGLPYHFGEGALVVIAVVLGAGVFATNVIGRKLVRFFENLLTRVPFISKVYFTIKQIRDAFIGQEHTLFNSVALVEFPRAGLYSVGFVTSEAGGEVQDRTKERVVCVFVPTTPNPTSGFLVFVPQEKLIALSMTVEEAMKLVISGGALVPPFKADELRAAELDQSQENGVLRDPGSTGDGPTAGV